MIPVVTPEQMAAVDAAAPVPVATLIDRAGAAVATSAVDLLGGTYGRRAVVLAGKGNNGADGRAAATRLRRRGVRVEVVDAADAPATLPPADLVIDAAYGTGLARPYDAPAADAPLVLAVDIPSGVDGRTGAAPGRPLAADRTVTFAALKPGLLFEPGRSLAGEVVVADIGLDVGACDVGLVGAADVRAWLLPRPATAHKWQAAVLVVAGSAGMTGAAHLAAAAAQRAGSGMVRLGSPGLDDDPGRPTEAVGVPLPAEGWAQAAGSAAERCQAVVLGPGLGTSASAASGVVSFLADIDRPVVLDGDGLTAVAGQIDVVAGRSAPTILTPHDGEHARLTDGPPGDDRIGAARTLARRTGAIVLLKGPTTVVASPEGQARIVTAGDARLATAGTGDVLSGTIGALLATGLSPFDAAAAGAWLHGRAAVLGPATGMVASDLVDHLPAAFVEVAR